MVAEYKAHLSTPLAQHQQQVSCLLGDPAAIGMGGHPGQVDPAGLQLNEEQHLQPPRRHGLDGEDVARDDPCGLLAQERRSGRGGPPRRRVQAVAAKRRADRGRGHMHVEPQELALDR
jgi:hypothetical protein